jgi:hypothetical protein
MGSPSEKSPVYAKFPLTQPNPEGTQTFGISCDEGWRVSIVCTGMYEWAADWLLGVLGHTPYAKYNLIERIKVEAWHCTACGWVWLGKPVLKKLRCPRLN